MLMIYVGVRGGRLDWKIPLMWSSRKANPTKIAAFNSFATPPRKAWNERKGSSSGSPLYPGYKIACLLVISHEVRRDLQIIASFHDVASLQSRVAWSASPCNTAGESLDVSQQGSIQPCHLDAVGAADLSFTFITASSITVSNTKS